MKSVTSAGFVDPGRFLSPRRFTFISSELHFSSTLCGKAISDSLENGVKPSPAQKTITLYDESVSNWDATCCPRVIVRRAVSRVASRATIDQSMREL